MDRHEVIMVKNTSVCMICFFLSPKCMDNTLNITSNQSNCPSITHFYRSSQVKTSYFVCGFLRMSCTIDHLLSLPPLLLGNNLPKMFNVCCLSKGQPGYIVSQPFASPLRFFPCSMASLIAVPSNM